MNFGQALELLKNGNKLARTGWNGQGMYIYLVKGSIVPRTQLRNEADEHYPLGEVNQDVLIAPHIDMKAANDAIVVGWTASQLDILAEDWVTVD